MHDHFLAPGRSVSLAPAFATGVLLFASDVAQGQTFFQYISEEGEFVGGGNSGFFDEDDGTFTPAYDEGGTVQVTFSGLGEGWTLQFDNGLDQPLQPGTYHDVMRFGTTPFGVPGLNATGNGNQCFAIKGLFVVSEIEVGPTGQLLVFAADFEQHCSTTDPALFGAIRINSSAPTLLDRIINGSEITRSFFYVSEPGDWVGQGNSELFTQDDGEFVLGYATSGFASVRFTETGVPAPWFMDFHSGSGEPLAVGSYLDAVRYPFNPPGVPGMSISGNSNGCSSLSGYFVISEIEVDSANDLKRFAVDFEQHCEGGEPALFGSVRIESDAPSLIDRMMGNSFAATYGMGTGCPCDNDYALGGCLNSTGVGATLSVAGGGNALTQNDLELLVCGLPPQQFAVMVASHDPGSAPFGDGLLRLSGVLERLAVQQADNSGLLVVSGVLSALGTVQAGDTLRFQSWYRDPYGPCMGGFNLTNGLEVEVAP